MTMWKPLSKNMKYGTWEHEDGNSYIQIAYNPNKDIYLISYGNRKNGISRYKKTKTLTSAKAEATKLRRQFSNGIVPSNDGFGHFNVGLQRGD